MSYICIEKKIRKLNLSREYDLNKIQIGIPVEYDEAEKVGLRNVGDMVLPSFGFGKICQRNALGYYFTDKSKEKKRRYICTNWVRPFGNSNASYVACDIYRPCYPKVYVDPMEIELMLYSNAEEKQFVMAYLEDKRTEQCLIQAIRIFIEIYGKCYVFKDNIKVSTTTNRRRCNWEILPPGKKPGVHLKQQLEHDNKSTETYDIKRLQVLDEYKVEEIVEGINGFKGYYAYLFTNHCILESAIYGNATYILPKDNWERMSQKTKGELLDEKAVIDKVDHKANWETKIRKLIMNFENQ